VVAGLPEGEREVVVAAVPFGDPPQLGDRYAVGVVGLDAVARHAGTVLLAGHAGELVHDPAESIGRRHRRATAGYPRSSASAAARIFVSSAALSASSGSGRYSRQMSSAFSRATSTGSRKAPSGPG
jgi:hypothetical protein